MSLPVGQKDLHHTPAHRHAFRAKAVAVFKATGWRVRLETACLLWNGPTNGAAGYGIVYANRRRVLAHRLALEMTLGRPIKPGMLATHTCDTPGCVNPLHLREGTPKSNMQERLERTGYSGATLTHCARGHEYTPENTALETWRGQTRRRCRTCTKLRRQLRREAGT